MSSRAFPAGESGSHPTQRVALLGAGYISDFHAKAVLNTPGVQLAAVCDRSIPRASSLAERYGAAEVFGSVEEMLAADPGLAVHVLVPPEHHAAATRAVLSAGSAALLEKPMAITSAECEELDALALENGVKLGVAHNFLFAEPYERLRSDIAAGRLGPIEDLTITWNKELGQVSFGPFDAWMLQSPTNILIEVAPHLTSVVRDLVGTTLDWSAAAGRPIDLPTGTTFYRRWRAHAEHEGTAVNLHMNFGPGFPEHTLHVRGRLATATVDFEQNTYVIRRHGPREIDFERLAIAHQESGQAVRQAWATIGDYALNKAKIARTGGNPYTGGIVRAVKSFHGARVGHLDPRLSAGFATDVIRMCEAIGEAATFAKATPADSAARPAPVATSALLNQFGDAESVDAAEVAVTAGDTDAATRPLLILGATGFIGRALVRQCLAEGRPVRALVRSARRLPADLRVAGVEIMEGDLSDAATVRRALDGIDSVVHLARANVKTWSDYERLEIEMTRTVAQTCLDAGVRRFVYSGTIDSYYSGDEGAIITEATGLDPEMSGRNLYAQAKAISEDLLMEMYRTKHLPLVIVRPGIVIGRGGSPFHWGVGMWRHNAVCQIWGEGNNLLPLVLVDDVARGLLAAVDTEGIEGESFNLVGPPLLTANQYLDALDSAAHMAVQRYPMAPERFFATDQFKWAVKMAVRFPERHRSSLRDWRSRTYAAQYDCSKAEQQLGWKAQSDRAELIREGIAVPVAEFAS